MNTVLCSCESQRKADTTRGSVGVHKREMEGSESVSEREHREKGEKTNGREEGKGE